VILPVLRGRSGDYVPPRAETSQTEDRKQAHSVIGSRSATAAIISRKRLKFGNEFRMAALAHSFRSWWLADWARSERASTRPMARLPAAWRPP